MRKKKALTHKDHIFWEALVRHVGTRQTHTHTPSIQGVEAERWGIQAHPGYRAWPACLKTANRTERGRKGRRTAVSGWCYTTSLFSACSQWPKSETSTSTCRVIFPSSEEFAEHQQSVMLNKTGQLFILLPLVSQHKANDLDSSAKDLDDTGWFLFSNCTFRQLRPQLGSGFRLEKTLVIEISEISGWSTLSCDS